MPQVFGQIMTKLNLLQHSATFDCRLPILCIFLRPWRFWWDFVAGPEHCLARPRHSANQRCPRWMSGAASWPDASSWTLRSENSSAVMALDVMMRQCAWQGSERTHQLEYHCCFSQAVANSHAKAAKEPCSLPTWCCSWWCLEATLLPSYSPGIFRPGGLNWACPPSYINHIKTTINPWSIKHQDRRHRTTRKIGFVWKCWVYSQWNSHLIGIMMDNDQQNHWV